MRNYQRNQGLAVDGIAGPVTLAHLGLAELGLGRRDQPAAAGAARGTRAERHAGQDRPVRVLRQPHRGLRVAASTAGSTSSRAQTWREYGGTGDPAAAPEAEQDRIAAALLAARGTAALAGLRQVAAAPSTGARAGTRLGSGAVPGLSGPASCTLASEQARAAPSLPTQRR